MEWYNVVYLIDLGYIVDSRGFLRNFAAKTFF